MPTKGSGTPFDPLRLVREYDLYDRNVDVVSAYQWLFTQTADLPATVEHFERYPKVEHPDGTTITPDFTILFRDGTGIAAEIANIPLRDEGVDKLCRQLSRYADLRALPDARQGQSPVTVLDVMYLAPMDIAEDAVQRVLVERLDEPSHFYKPVRRPVVVQFTRTSEKYIFQMWPDSVTNGSLHTGNRSPNYASFSTLNIKPHCFASVKIQHAFMNDPISPLYLATRLWASTFPTQFGGGTVEFDVTTQGIVSTLREQYGVGRADDVRRAMSILVAAGLATERTGNKWTVNRRLLRKANSDIHRLIADRIGIDESRPTQRSGRRQQRRFDPGPGQATLFDIS